MKERKKVNRKKKLKLWAALAFLCIFALLMVFLFSGGNIEILKQVFKKDVSKEEIRSALSGFGIKGYITVGILSMFQVVFTFLPAEPVQVIGGISFGLWRGGAACLAGVFLGNNLIFILYKIYGDRLNEYFENNAEFDFESARKSPKIALIVFILYFLPAIPYGLICFFTASLGLKYHKYITLTTIGSIPSILIGVGLGHMAIASGWIVSLIVFAVLLILLVLLFKNKTAVFKKVNEFMKSREKKNGSPKKANGAVLGILAFFSRIIFENRIKVRLKNNVGRLEKPSIVLCNHGSFLDFVYAGRLLRKEKPHFVAARLYFYHGILGKIMRSLGCLPKSMFTVDLENAKNCIRVLSDGGVLAMMPEARLSTVGKFEGIQESTYKFIRRSAVAVYTVRLNGDYLADPKWGKGVRRGALIEAELNPLFKAGETKDLPLEELKKRVDAALFYDEFEWLKERPHVRYKSKKIAEGLENILYLCPNCGGRYAFTSRRDTIACEKCGAKFTVDDRYGFGEKQPFVNFAKWYEWECGETEKEILRSPEYKLESRVELRHASKDGKGLTRHAGEGVCVLDRNGLRYEGTRDGETVEKFFPLSDIYRLLFGAGEDFEIYEGKEIWYFVPENRRSAVEWYVVSGLLKQISDKE